MTDNIEIDLMASICIDLSYISMIEPENLMLRESFTHLFRLAKERFSTGEKVLSYSFALSRIEKYKYPIAPYEIDAVFNRVNELEQLNKTQIDKKFHAAYDVMKEEGRIRDITMEIDYARDLVNRGYITKGLKTLRSIRYTEPVETIDTMNLMKESVKMSQGFKTNIKQFDDTMGGLLKSNIMSVIGASGAMKTRFTLWMSLQILKANPNFTCYYFEKEMHEKDIGNMLLQNAIKLDMPTLLKVTLDSKDVKDQFILDVNDQVDNLDEETKDAIERLKIIPQNQFATAHDIYEILDRNRPDIWVLDFVSLIYNIGKSQKNNTTETAINALDVLKSASLNTQSFGVLVNQINKNTASVRSNKIPTINDIEWGNRVHHLSAYIYSIFRPRQYYTNKDFPYEGVSMKPADFYLVQHKGRHGSTNLYFEAQARIMDFKESEEKEVERMKSWLKLYNT